VTLSGLAIDGNALHCLARHDVAMLCIPSGALMSQCSAFAYRDMMFRRCSHCLAEHGVAAWLFHGMAKSKPTASTVAGEPRLALS